MGKHQNGWETFKFPHTYACNLQVYRATKLLPFSLVITRLPLGPTAVVRRMPPDVTGMNSSLVSTLRLIHRAAVVRKTANRNSRNALAPYNKSYNKHFRLDTGYAAGGLLFVERPSQTPTVADYTAYEEYSRLLPHHT